MDKGFIIRSGEFNATTGLTFLGIWSILFFIPILSILFPHVSGEERRLPP
jgi:hypothetical protein